MEALADQSLISFYNNIDLLLLIAVRIFGLLMIIPVLSGEYIPTMGKVALSVAIAFLLMTSNVVTQVNYDNNVAGYIILLVREFLVGFTIGVVVYLVFSVAYFIGQLIDYQIGFSMVSVFDPIMQIQVPIVGNLLYLMMGIFLIQAGGLYAFISAIFYSYKVLPPGTAEIIGNGNVVYYILSIITNYFVIGVQVALPLVGTVLIIDIALGLLVKAVPQMNIFVVGMPLKLFIGLIVFYLIMPIFYDVYDLLFNESYRAVVNIIKGMVP